MTSSPKPDTFGERLDALDRTWQVWARLGATLSEGQWSAPSRCTGWDVAAVYAHHSAFPLLLSGPGPPMPADLPDAPITAVEILRGFNAAGGAAYTMAAAVADGAVQAAAAHTRAELVERFDVQGQAAVRRLRGSEPTAVVPWPAARAGVTVVETLRIVLMEAVVHLLDVQRALDLAPDVPPSGLRQTAQLLADLAPPVNLIEAATGRSAISPLPVLR